VVIAIQITFLGYVYGSFTFVYNIGIIFLNLIVIHLLRRKKLNICTRHKCMSAIYNVWHVVS
jgi:hypothetical protein